MKTFAISALLALILLIDSFLPRAGSGQDRIRIGVPSEASVENLTKMITYVDKRGATVDRGKLAD